MPDLVPAIVACGVPAAVWAARRAWTVRHFEAGLHRIWRTSRSPIAGEIQVGPGDRPADAGRSTGGGIAFLDRVGAFVLTTRAGAALGRRIAGAHPSVPPARGAAVVVLTLAAGLAVPLLLGRPGAALLGLPAALALTAALGRRHEARRREVIERQLSDALLLQANALRAGHSVAGSLGSAGRHCGPPLGPELVRTATALRLGSSLEDALGNLARDCGTSKVQPWIAAMLATRPTGGDLSRTLTSLAARIRERGQLESELRALTAQGRLSGTVVALAPLGFLALTAASSRKEAQALYGTRAGLVVLWAGALLDVAGLLWIRRIAGVRA